MLGHRELTIEDYAGILKRRFWLILCVGCSLPRGRDRPHILPACTVRFADAGTDRAAEGPGRLR